MKDVVFTPWVGKNYKNSSPKIMVMGESAFYWEETEKEDMYAINEECKEFNKEIIKCHCLPESKDKRSKTFTKFIRVLSGQEYDSEENMAYWHNVIFYNYIQGFIGTEHHHDKRFLDDELLEKSRKAFYEVLDKHKPDLIVAWGKSNLPCWMPPNDFKYIDEENFIWKYDAYPNVLIWNIYHPSSKAFNTYGLENYQKVYKNKILKLLKNNLQ